MARVIWRGPEREFPALGRVVREGDEVELPDEQAEAMVAYGLAEYPKVKQKGGDG